MFIYLYYVLYYFLSQWMGFLYLKRKAQNMKTEFQVVSTHVVKILDHLKEKWLSY